ncbi:MAG TPA: hypothetical protein VFG23_02940 [Polyangia bacterium]|nr:hypothetical protein [Polyangia bacterium]
MNATRILLVATLAFSTALTACATTQTTSTTWTNSNGRPGQVEVVRELVRRTESQPVLGAVTGALIGGAFAGGPWWQFHRRSSGRCGHWRRHEPGLV